MIVLIYPLVRAVQVVSLAEVIAAEESSKQEKCDADTLDKIETIVPAPAPQQVQIRADLDRAGKNSGDEPAASVKDTAAAAEKAIAKTTATARAAALQAAVELRQNSDALDAETTRIRQLQRQRALKVAETRATSEPTPPGDLKQAENKVCLQYRSFGGALMCA
jgi:hypothetical protein